MLLHSKFFMSRHRVAYSLFSLYTKEYISTFIFVTFNFLLIAVTNTFFQMTFYKKYFLSYGFLILFFFVVDKTRLSLLQYS